MTQMTDSGLKFEDTTVGEGDVACKGQTVSVHYTGWLENGTKFDSSKDRNEPFRIQARRRAGDSRLGRGRGRHEGRRGTAPDHSAATRLW